MLNLLQNKFSLISCDFVNEKFSAIMKILIKNANIINGDGVTPPYLSDLLIVDELIEKIEKNIKLQDDITFDLKGNYLTPGFIDSHSHYDLAYFTDDLLHSKIQQGITTEITGQCGLGVHPMPKSLQPQFRNSLLIGDLPIDWSWESSAEYLSALQKNRLAINNVPSIAHGVLRYTQTRDQNLPLTDEQIKNICELAEVGFRAGIKILSFGFIYLPALYYRKNEVKALLEVAAKYDVIVSVHMKSESDKIVKALTEIASLANQAHCQLHISHLKIIGNEHAKFLPEIFALIEKHNLTFDTYFYNNGCTLLASLIPPELMDARGLEVTCERLKDKDFRELVQKTVEKNSSTLPWDNLYKFLGAKNILIDSLEINKHLIGKNLTEIPLGKNPLEAMLLLLAEEKGHILMKDYFSTEEVAEKILVHPKGVFSTDSLPLSTHPRGFVTFPRILKQAVFQKKILPLETAIYKMSEYPAKIFGLEKRGLIKEKYYADLVSFSDKIDYEGKEVKNLDLVIINGSPVKIEGQIKRGIKQGKILLNQKLQNLPS